ncbi:Thp3p [Sugiyamaella lignohabitans]|uniref:Thp3p n=1 Tax=Sugiyamaella lignohabitans TaxID=796027 RepID=A0A167F5K1_9ASCO|nr:Thp3p [Sugiyamaella lignohabitans]ANB14858.1 Thp3p [Sugiyamaella lignohabitans]
MSLGRSASSSASAKEHAQESKRAASESERDGQWPESLKEFVAKCFKEVHPEDKEVMESQLKQIITKAFETKTTWTIDWKSMWVPVMLERRHKEQELNNSKRAALDAKSKVGGIKKKKKIDGKIAESGGFAGRAAASAEYSGYKRDSFGQASNNDVLGAYSNSNSSSNYGNGYSDDFASNERREKRLRRFEREARMSPTPPSTAPAMTAAATGAIPSIDLERPVVGRATNLEKKYFRLTSAPDPDQVRPLNILKQTLELLKDKWRKEQNYPYICDQFKSLRQDLTIQHIENEFTVSVYEIHARIALEKGDLGEYNQCQSRLKELYDKHIRGNANEFLAYRILYLLHTHNRAEIGHLLRELSGNEPALKDAGVAHALLVDKAMTRKNYHQLFRLYTEAPKMGGYVMDSFIPRERLSALAAMCTAYRPDLSLEFISHELAFDEIQQCLEFLDQHGLLDHVKKDPLKLNTKDAYAKIETARQSAYKKVDIKGQI